MTRTERKKLAKAARELAMEYAAGRGPKLNSMNWCGCAAGQIFKRAGVENDGGEAAAMLDAAVGYILTGATSRQVHGERYGFSLRPVPGAVVFPLLWAADELESQP